MGKVSCFALRVVVTAATGYLVYRFALDEETRAELREMTRAAFSTIRATSRDLLAASGLLGGPDPARHMTRQTSINRMLLKRTQEVCETPD